MHMSVSESVWKIEINGTIFEMLTHCATYQIGGCTPAGRNGNC